MNNKPTIFIVLFFSLSLLNLYSADKSINDTAKITGNMTTTWGTDLNTDASGFSEKIDIDFLWDVGEWGDYSSDISDVSFKKAYGMAFVSGGLVRFKIENGDDGNDLKMDNNEGNDIMKVQVQLENAWAKVIMNDFYVLLSAAGTNYERQAGYNFNGSRDALRANWAHIGSRLQKSYILNTDDWNVNDDMDAIGTTGPTAGLTFGVDLENFRTYLSIGSENDMTKNIDNEYDFSWSAEWKPVESLVVNSSVISGINYDAIPLGFGTSLLYDYKLTSTLTFKPFIAFDGKFNYDDNNDYTSIYSETAYGLTLEWPGANGWGQEWLFDNSDGLEYGFEKNWSNRYSGFTVSGNMVNIDNIQFHNIQASLYEETIEGLIPYIGASLLFEMKDITSTDMEYAFGGHIEYNHMNMFNVFTKAERSIDDDRSLDDIYFAAGIDWLSIPNITISLRYDNSSINDLDKDMGQVRLMGNLTL